MKPRPLHITFAFQFVGGKEGDGKNPEGARQFYGGADREGFVAVFCGGADDGASVVNYERGPTGRTEIGSCAARKLMGGNSSRATEFNTKIVPSETAISSSNT